MARLTFLFPGQGAQHVGMAKELCEQSETARKLFELADEQLGFSLSKICFEGPDERINATDVSQPAIFTHSAAMLAVMGEHESFAGRSLDVAAGLSLGEYSALYAADAFDFQTGLKLVSLRGQYMQAASEAEPSGMVAIVGLDEEKVNELCAEAAGGQVLAPANFNSPGQVAISGHKAACERAVGLADKFGCRAIPLAVAGAFHTDLMAPAAEKLAPVIAESEIRMPNAQVIANVTAKPYESADEIRELLVRQITNPIRWSQSMQLLAGGGDVDAYEVGPGRVLSGLMRKIDRGIKVKVVNSAADLAG